MSRQKCADFTSHSSRTPFGVRLKRNSKTTACRKIVGAQRLRAIAAGIAMDVTRGSLNQNAGSVMPQIGFTVNLI